MKREQVVLRDGSAVRIGPVQPADAPLLAEGFALSVRNRSLRDSSLRRALVAADNAAIDSLLHAFGGNLRVLHRESDVIEYEITPPPQKAGGLRALLREFARGEIPPPGPVGQVLAVLVPDRFSDHRG